jgi:Toxin PAAR-like domain
MPAIFPASTKGGGQAFGAPNVDITPAAPSPIPVPYPSIGMLNQAKSESTKVKFAGKGVLTKKSEVPQTMGDEAGTNKGVMSGSNMDKMVFKKCSSKVKIEGQECAHLTSVTGHNGSNANCPAGTQVAPSQTKVIISP